MPHPFGSVPRRFLSQVSPKPAGLPFIMHGSGFFAPTQLLEVFPDVPGEFAR
jgi:hypothetical protein